MHSNVNALHDLAKNCNHSAVNANSYTLSAKDDYKQDHYLPENCKEKVKQ